MSIANVQSITAGLAPDSQQVISGVAVGNGDITRGLSGDRKKWTAEELREAAASLEGTPINPLHSQQEVGEVVRAGFDPDRGVIYEAELNDKKLAEQAANGQLEVSIEARHANGGTVETDSGEAMLATDINFTGMAMVQHGAAPSATADAGEAAALSPADIHEALFDPVKHPRNPENGKFVERPYPVPDDIANTPTQQVIADAWAQDPDFADNLEKIAVDNEYTGPRTAKTIVENARKQNSSITYGVDAAKRDILENSELDVSFEEFNEKIEQAKEDESAITAGLDTLGVAFAIAEGNIDA